MKARKIKTLNNFIGAGNSLSVDAKDYNNVIEDLSILYPSINNKFTGEIDLSKQYTHYLDYTVVDNIAITTSTQKIIGGSAEIRMIGDGSHTPTFTGLTASSSSGEYTNTAAAINKVIFYYDGTDVFYSISAIT
jgi:hypothetical protein